MVSSDDFKPTKVPATSALQAPTPLNNRQSPLALLLVISAVLGVGTFWLQQNKASLAKPGQLPPELQDEPDLYIDSAVIHQFNADGSRKYLLRAERVSHFDNKPEQNSPADASIDRSLTRMEQPDLLLTPPNAEPWQATANYGYVRQRNAPEGGLEEVVFLRENVELEQKRTPPAFISVRGSALYLYPDREFVESSESVTIDTHTGRTTASNMRGNLATGVLQMSGTTTQVQTIVLPFQFK